MLRRTLSPAILLSCCALPAIGQEKLHFTYLWHLEQPIYWPQRQTSGNDRYQRAWESIQVKDSGAAHPQDDLRGIFGIDDRKAIYQYRVKDSISAISGAPEAGAQITYSGGLIENITSLGNAGQLGYGSGWYNDFRTARSWFTGASGVNKPRLDVVLFSFHHAMLPLLDDAAVRKEIQLYKRIYPDAWGGSVAMSRGFFPSEMAFSERLIPILASEGVAWTFVSAEKLSRACVDFPVVFGSGGINCDPPNKADQTNPAAGAYFRQSISRGCGPAEAVPFAYTPHRARYIDPATGAASELILVPCSQHMGWKDGYAPLGLGDFNTVDAMSRPSRPMLVVLAHDGDNAWGGGYSYYMEATPNLVSQARSSGYVPTVVEKYLNDHPVPANDYVHIEQGAWVNADGDFGAPQMLNWNWPLLNAAGQVDIDNGWHEDPRNWAVITAATNRVQTAEQIHTDAGGTISLGKILYPDSGTNNAERAWHYFLGGLNSGFMYYGTALDMEVKPSLAANQAMQYADPVIGNAAADRTAPTIWNPQRQPWNPGSTNFGPQYGYRQVTDSGDFKVWTFVYDASGVSSVTLKYRLDDDGGNGPDNANETYAGGAGVGAWQSIPMTRRVFPANNVYNNGGIDFFIMPQYIADQYTANVTGIRSKLVDYYVEAADTKGNVKKSDIQHVWVGAGSGSGGGGGGSGPVVSLSPAIPVAGQNVTITYDPTGRNLAGASTVKIHHGINNWATVTSPDPAMTLASGKWQITIPVAATATQLDMVFNDGASTWDNNAGQDWHFAVQAGTPPPPTWVMDGVRDTASTLIARNQMSLWAGLSGDVLYVATEDAGEGNDHFILLARTPGPLRAAMWAKAGMVAGWDAFLADENSNDYEGWFDANPGTAVQAMTGANGGVLEGTINLRQEFGTLPEDIYLAVALFGNADGGQLLRTHQVGPSVNNDFNVDASEYVLVHLCSLTPEGCSPPCPADYNTDGGIDGADVDAFFSDWAFGLPGADINQDGGIDGSDVGAFFALWEAGGC
ncbi:MAG: hypothetical protein JSR77_10515 [Planctomycetes bacterium]|nr:hypothetical protein [Planctomycetota bacterium]